MTTKNFTAPLASDPTLFYQTPSHTYWWSNTLEKGVLISDSPQNPLDILKSPSCYSIDFSKPAADERILGGFYECENEQLRWMSQRGHFLLNVPPRVDHFFVKGYAPVQLFKKGKVELQVHSQDLLLGRIILKEPGSFTRLLKISPELLPRSSDQTTVLTITCSCVFVPGKEDATSGDFRTLSIVVLSVGVGKLEKDELKIEENEKTAADIISQPPHPYFVGTCVICGNKSKFVLDKPELIRDSFLCSKCGSLNRWRQLARGMLRYFKSKGYCASTIPQLAREIKGSDITIYDTFSAYVIAGQMKEAGANYITSEYYPDIEPGTQIREGHYCQDLSKLSFENNSVDVVLTTDVFEHVRLHKEAFSEIYRVLKPGGCLIFTVPHHIENEKNDIYVDVKDSKQPALDKYLHPATYHGDPLAKEGALVYRIYGKEIFCELEEAGFEVTYENSTLPHLGIYKCEIFICVKRDDKEITNNQSTNRVGILDLNRWNERMLDRDSLIEIHNKYASLLSKAQSSTNVETKEKAALVRKVTTYIADAQIRLGLGIPAIISGQAKPKVLFDQSTHPSAFPVFPWDLEWINIELSSACNLRCRWCILDHKKPPTFLPIELLETALLDIANGNAPALKRLDMHNGGETLLHPQIDKALEILSRYKNKISYSTTVCMLTNGTLLKGELAEQVIRCNAFDEVRFSIDGGSPQAFEWIRLKASWEEISQNVKNFVQLKQKFNSRTKVGIICMIPKDRPATTEWMDPEFADVLKLADILEIRYPHTWEGTMDQIEGMVADPKQKRADRLCKFLGRNLVVLASGKVTVCCADLNSRGVIGDLRNNTLSDLWMGEKRLEMLHNWRNGDFGSIPICSTCEGYY